VLLPDQILDNVWQFKFEGDATVVGTYVRYLRKECDEMEPPLILTIRLVGYALREPGNA